MTEAGLGQPAAPAAPTPAGAATSAAASPAPLVAERHEAEHLRDLTGHQWRSGIAAWLGWLFDGLDMHLYTLVAAPFVAQLLGGLATSDPAVKSKSAWIQAAFLVGWALGGGFFGRVGDLFGRSRALGLTIFTYALFTGLSFFAATWWHLLIFRFLAALGIGGEWAVGSSLLSETWPRKWRAWVAAVLQTGVNLGVLLACATVYLITGSLPVAHPERYVFLVGILPALLVFWIRLSVGEPAEWHAARAEARADDRAPGVADLFKGEVRRTTLLTIVVCACSLTAWWAFMFWHVQHLRNLPDVAGWSEPDKGRLVSAAFFAVIGVSIVGNFFAAWLARRFGYKRAISIMCLGFFFAMVGTYGVQRDHASVLRWIPWVGFFSGVFGLFTMYLPPLFPVLLRTTGAGFSYNIGRIAAAFGTVFFGTIWAPKDLSVVLLAVSFLFLPAMLVAMLMPDLRDQAPEAKV
jgi:MFS family permease